jgi:two-component system, NarL family, sensor kinase
VHTVARREFTDGDVELLRVIGRLIAGAMHQARLHRQLVARERAHELFVEQVIEAQELERRRVAGDIHDGISQRLITLSYRLDAAARAVGTDPEEASRQLAEARAMVGLTLDEARVAISGLRPPVLDDLGLAGGLASLARNSTWLTCDCQSTSRSRCTGSPRKACRTSSSTPTLRWRGCGSRWTTTSLGSKSWTTE